MKESNQCLSLKGAGLDRLFYPAKIGKIIRSSKENKTIRPIGLKMKKDLLKYLLQGEDEDEDEGDDKKKEEEGEEEEEEV